MRRMQLCKVDSLDSLKQGLLAQAKVFIDFCEEHGIKYYVAGGTAVGALRHEGFIPWDDDFDFSMREDDYEKFREAIKKNPIKNIKFTDYRDMPDPDSSIAGLANQKGIHLSVFKLHKKYAGFSVDVFKFAPLKKTKDTQKALNMHRIFMGLINPARVFYIPDSNHYYRNVLRFYYLSKFLPLNVLEKLFFRKLYAKDTDDFDYYVVNHNIDEPILYRRDLYENIELKYMKFENLTVPVPANHTDIMWNRFGGSAWRYIPREYSRRSHATFINSTGIPHRAIRDDYLQFVDDMPKYKRVLKITRIVNFKKQWRMRKIMHKLESIRLPLLEDSLNRYFAANGIDIEGELANGNHSLLGKIFAQWYRLQFSGKKNFYRDERILLDITDEYLYPLSYTLLVYEGEYYTVKKIINLIKKKRPLSKEFLALEDVIGVIEDAYYKYDNEEYDAALKALDGVAKDFSEQINIVVLRMDIQSKFSKDQNDFMELRDEAERYLKIFPENGDLMKYLGDAYFGLGQKDRAKRIYKSAVNVTENGFTKLDIKKKLKAL